MRTRCEYGVREHTFIGTLVLLLAVNFLTPGYQFGYGEQMLLSIKGISWADSTAFNGDWFNDFAPQPHVLFDVITFVGEKISFLAGVYLVYYIASCLAFALGTAILAQAWLPKSHQYLQHLVNILVVIGPVFLLGTFLTIHFQAVPNMAGGCLAYLAVACLLTNRWNLAAFSIVGCSFLHLQHGIAISSIAFLFLLFNLINRKKLIVYSSILSLLISLSTAIYRDLLSGSSEIANEAAEIGSTGHLNVETWTTPAIVSGLIVLSFSVMNFLIKKTHEKRLRVTILFASIFCGPFIGIMSDLNNIEPLQSLARSLFIYRYSMILAPFACWFIVRQISIAYTASFPIANVSLLVFGLSFVQYFSTTFTNFPELGSLWLTLSIVITVLVTKFSSQRLNLDHRISIVVFFGIVVLIFGMGIDKFNNFWPKIDYAETDNAVIVSRSMSTALRQDDVLASDPSIPWIRILTRRAIVADCKGVPYGGAPWHEYTRRLRALGVEQPNVCSGFKTLTLQKILDLPHSVGASTILLLPDDLAYEAAKSELSIRWTSGGKSPWLIFELPLKK
jgi:hypothetical protein